MKRDQQLEHAKVPLGRALRGGQDASAEGRSLCQSASGAAAHRRAAHAGGMMSTAKLARRGAEVARREEQLAQREAEIEASNLSSLATVHKATEILRGALKSQAEADRLLRLAALVMAAAQQRAASAGVSQGEIAAILRQELCAVLDGLTTVALYDDDPCRQQQAFADLEKAVGLDRGIVQ